MGVISHCPFVTIQVITEADCINLVIFKRIFKIMKKNFSLTSPAHKQDRHIELLKHEINKYLARERRKPLPEGVSRWAFDCKCGPDEATAAVIHVSVIGKHIDEIAATKAENIYIEILAKPIVQIKKLKPSDEG